MHTPEESQRHLPAPVILFLYFQLSLVTLICSREGWKGSSITTHRGFCPDKSDSGPSTPADDDGNVKLPWQREVIFGGGEEREVLKTELERNQSGGRPF